MPPITSYAGKKAKTYDHLHVKDNVHQWALYDENDTIGTTAATNYSATVKGGKVELINGIAVDSSDVDGRTGRSIKIHKLMLRWHILNDQHSAAQYSTPMTALVAIVKDTTPGASEPDYSDIWKDTGFNPTAILEHPLSFMNVDNSGRFKVLYRRICYFGGTSGSASGGTKEPWNYSGHQFDDYYVELNQKVRYDGAGSNVSDIHDCAYYLVTCPVYHGFNTTTGDLADANPPYIFQAHSRLTYEDM